MSTLRLPVPPWLRVPRTVRARLQLLVLLLLVPTVSVSLIAAYTVYVERRASVTAAALETARALSLVADREMAVRAAVLRTLSTSASLERGDLQAFHREAKAVVPTNENTIVLSTPEGEQLLNTRVPFGDGPLPRSNALVASVKSLDGGAAVVSNLYMAPVGQRHSFAVHVPVEREGRTRWFLGMGSFASQLQRIFAQQPLPQGWVGSVLDASGTLVARNTQSERLVGRRATPDMLQALAAAPHGLQETRTLEGVPVVTVFARAPESGWTVLIGLPREDLRRPAWQAFGTMMFVTAGFVALAALVAMRVARGVSDPVRRLQADADAMGRGERVAPADTGLDETDAVQRRLAEASRDRLEADERLRERVHKAVADAERAQRALLANQKLEALGRLTGGIAHDFNNLLQTMTTGLQLASRLSDPDKARNALALCERAVSKAVKLTRQLMTFGRAQPGHLEVVALAHQLDGLRDLLRGAVRDSIEMRFDIAPDVWPVRVDPVQLELALLNLVINSRDAIGVQGRVTVGAANRPLADGEVGGLAAGDYVALSVADDGEGIAPEHLHSVFEPFFTTKPLGKGSGMGLAQVYGFAQASGGTASVRSQPGAGTTVTVWLPRCAAADAGAAAAPQDAAALAAYRGTVLLVEDEALVRGLISDALQARGFQVIVAANGDDGLALARSRADIDVVLSDIVMPGGQSGIDLARTLRILRPALPVVLASGYADAKDDELGVPVVAKPYDVDEVAAQLARLMRTAGDAGKSGGESGGESGGGA